MPFLGILPGQVHRFALRTANNVGELTNNAADGANIVLRVLDGTRCDIAGFCSAKP